LDIEKAFIKVQELSIEKNSMEKLVNHPSILIRHYLARRDSTSLNVLKQLIWDEDMLVRDYATRNYLKKKRKKKIEDSI